jgi:AsmA protein
MKQEKALNKASVNISFTGNPTTLIIDSLEAQLDDIFLKGTASIDNFTNPYYVFDFDLNQLNLDYYAPKQPPKKNRTSTESKPLTMKKIVTKINKNKSTIKPSSIAVPSSFLALRQLHLKGQLQIDHFIAAGAKMNHVNVTLKSQHGILQLAPLTAELYQGNLYLKSDINVQTQTPQLSFNNELKNIQIGDLLYDITGTREFLGNANIKATLHTHGNNDKQLTKNSQGNIQLRVTHGKIKKLTILHTLRKANALLKGQPFPSEKQQHNTEFTEVKGHFLIKNGVVYNNDLSSHSPLLTLTGKGYIDFPKQYLDYTLAIKLLNSLKIDKHSQGTDFRGKVIPYTIKGPFSQLSEKAQLSEIFKTEIKEKLQKKLNKKLEEKLGDKFKNLIKF